MANPDMQVLQQCTKPSNLNNDFNHKCNIRTAIKLQHSNTTGKSKTGRCDATHSTSAQALSMQLVLAAMISSLRVM
jgi:hypothetical protein